MNAVATMSLAVSQREDFSSDPLTRGWEQTGDTNLFRWDATNQHLEVTWDSSKTNSYLRLPFGRMVTSEEDFSFAAAFLLHDITPGTRPGFPGAFQIAFGMQYRADADKPTFIRGTGSDAPNLVEFNYFPDSGFGATVWPVMVPTTGTVNYSGTGDFAIFELPLEVWLQLTMRYTASNHTVTLTITSNGTVAGQVVDAPLVNTQAGFKLDAFVIASYSDGGQNPVYPGSVLAHGVVDNVEIVLPPPPIGLTSGGLAGGEWRQQFSSVRGWKYRLQASEDLVTWNDVGTEMEGTGEFMTLGVGNEPSALHRFFRVKALPVGIKEGH